MRHTTLIALLVSMLGTSLHAHVSDAQTLSEVTIEFRTQGEPLKEVLRKIEKLSPFRFVYNPDQLPLSDAVSYQRKQASLEEILSNLLDQRNIMYRQQGMNIVLSRTSGENRRLQPAGISGKVSDEAGQPLPGVSITIKGSPSRGASTDIDGLYRVEAEKGESLVFSLIGYQQQEILLTGQQVLNVTMQQDVAGLDEVVVVGYGTSRKSDLTGSVVSLQERDFTKGVNNNALQLLNGRAAGVHVSQASSEPGGGMSVRIRGAGSINSSNDVLIVVDGLPGATVESLNPGDIESIEVLKDASSAAIYGTRAANGVILITTKKGKAGKPQLSYNSYVGIQSVAKEIDVLSAQDYMEVLNGIRGEQGQDPAFSQEQIAAVGTGTDWQDEIFRTALAQDHQLSFSGGSENSSYYAALNYFRQEGVVQGSDLNKYNVRVNYQLTPLDRLKINLSLNTNRSVNNSIFTSNRANENAGPINAAIQFDPTMGTGLDANGRYLLNPLIALENPLALIHGISEHEVINRTFGTVAADYEVLPQLTATARLGADFTNQRFDSYNSRITQMGRAAGGIASIVSADNSHWLAEFLAQYERNFGGIHRLTVMGGVTFEEFNNRNVESTGANFLSDVTGTDQFQSGDRSQFNITSTRNRNRLNSFLGRINYNLKEKYLLTASIRADGTSRFSADNKYAIFPSLALAWRLIQEPFLAGSGLFSDLKLRAGFGRMGNQGINNFETMQTFRPGGAAVLGDAIVQGVIPSRVPNPDLRWETTEEINAGVDFGLWSGRLSGSIEYFVKNTKDQLFNKPIPSTTGFANTRVNFGNVRNQGLDIALQSFNIDKALQWRTSLTLSMLKNKVTKLPDFIPEIVTGNIGTFINDFSIVREGAPMRAFYGYEISGIFQSEDEIAGSAQPDAAPGHPIFKDQNGDGMINAQDRVILGDPFPDYTIGFNNSFSYKGFSLDILFVGVQGIETLDANIVESLYPINFERNRIASHYLDRWTPANPDARYPSGVNPSTYGGARAINSLTVTDASFFRLKTVSLSYTLPLGNRSVVSAASVFLAGDNLFTITDFEGFDPDANANGNDVLRTAYNSYPLNRTFRLGLNLTL